MYVQKFLKKSLLLLALGLYSGFAEQIIAADPVSSVVVQPPVREGYDLIADHHLQTCALEEEHINFHRMGPWLEWTLKNQQHPQERNLRSQALKILRAAQIKQKDAPAAIMAPATWDDLNLLAGAATSPKTYLGSIISRAETELGRAALLGALAYPTSDINELQRRQGLVKTLVVDDDMRTLFSEKLADMARSEALVLSFWGQDALLNASQRSFFTLLFADFMNQNELCLDIKNLHDHAGRMMCLVAGLGAVTILPLYVISQYADFKLPARLERFAAGSAGMSGPLGLMLSLIENKYFQTQVAIASALTAGLMLKESFDWTADNFILDRCLQVKVVALATYVQTLLALDKTLALHPELVMQLPNLKHVQQFVHEAPRLNKALADLLRVLQTSSANSRPSLFKRNGPVYKAFRLMHQTREAFECAMAAAGELDAYLSVAKLYKEFEHERVKYSFVEFVADAKPFVELRDFWNPFVDPARVVTNSLRLGKGSASHAIVTGPNAGGKSTIMKSVALSLILAQSFGIAPAAHMRFTLFNRIATCFHVVDDIAAGNSLFRSQVLSAQGHITALQELKAHGQFGFMAVDELFNGTSPREGQAAAYSVAKHLGSFDNGIVMISTHYPLLTRLAERVSHFGNYRIVAERLPNGKIKYLFKIEPGISNQFVAIDVLRSEGLAGSVVNEAQEIMNSLAAAS